MTTKTSRPSIVIGQAQGGRPYAAPTTGAHAQQSERPLHGALLVPIEQLRPDPQQPRTEFGPVGLEELAASLREYGVLQPLVVREDGFLDDGRNLYTIIAGGRRYLASQLAGLTRLPVLVREGEGVRLRVLQLIENLQREELSPVDEARAYREIMELQNLTIRDVAGLIHRSRGYVSERLDLVKSEEVATAVKAGRVTASAAAVVAREKDPEARRDLLRRTEQERLQRKDVERILRERSRPPVPTPMPHPTQATLREVAREMGATEGQVLAAAEARRQEPELTPPEALALVMHAPPEPVRDATPAAADNPCPTINDLVTADAILRTIEWARGNSITLIDDLYRIVRERRDYLARDS